MIATSIEQSKELVRLGLYPKTSDMSYSEEYFGKDNDGNDEWCWRLNACRFIDVEGIIPAWSLSALLEVMPKELEVGLFKTPISGEYFFSWWTDEHHMGDDYKEPIDAAYEMVCLLLKQGLIKKGGNDENETNVHSNAD